MIDSPTASCAALRLGVARDGVEAVSPDVDVLLVAGEQQAVRKAARADEAVGLAEAAPDLASDAKVIFVLCFMERVTPYEKERHAGKLHSRS
jgi:hypothetical protein